MMRKFRLFGVLALVFMLVPSFALADMGSSWPHVIWSQDYEVEGNIDDYRHVLVAADDTYNATLAIIGLNPLNVDSDIRSFLSDETYSPHFMHIASSLWRVEDWNNNVPDWVPTYVYQYLPLDPDHAYFGNVDTYEIKQAYKEYTQAKEYAEDGTLPDSGGGDVSDVTSGTWTVNFTPSMYRGSTRFRNVDGYDVTTLSPSVTFSLDSSYGDASYVGSNAYVLDDLKNCNYIVFFYGMGSAISSTFFYIAPSNTYPTFSYVNSFYDRTRVNFSAVRGSYWHPNTRVSKNLVTEVFANPSYYSGGQANYLEQWNTWVCVMTPDDFFSSPAPPAPDGDWPEPETPETPTAPEQPSPDAPTPEPDPVVPDPDITWPGIPLVTEPLEEGLDYTGLLTAIYNQLCDMEETMVDGFLAIQRGQQNIISYLDNLDSVLELHCKHLRDALDDGIYNLELYIKSLFEWLPQQLDFDANFDYDDSGIKSYLQRILNKIPGGATGTPQTYMPNPQSDEPGFFDWLLDLWHRFLIDLISVLPDELGGLVDAFSQLTHYFPFSIPWDLAAMLALFEHEPVTPVFDVPWGFGGDDGEIEMVRVDLSAWDGVMEMVRPVFLVGFCFQLALITKDLLSNFDINKGGV